MSAASRISVEVAGSSLSLQEAVGKAADSLKELGAILSRQTDLALSASAKTVRANELVGKSFQQSAVTAGAASDRTIAAFERQGAVALDSAKTQVRASEQTAAASKAASDRIVVGLDEQSVAAIRAANTHVSAGRKAQQAFGSSSSAISKAGKTITIGLLGAAAASAMLAVRFQSNTLRLQTQAGATAGQLDKLRKGILAMAPAVGIGPNQLANGMYHVVSSMNAVLPASQRVTGELKVLRYAAELATVGHSSLEETTYALASAMNALHAPISQTAKVTGELNAIVGAGDMTMTDLIDAFKSGLVPSARVAGISLQSLGSALAVMGDMGMRGALAGTRLRMSIALLSSPSAAAAKVLQTLGLSSKEATSTSEAMSKALERAGLRTTTLSADLRQPNGIMVALKDLNDHLRGSGLTATGAAAVMNKAFGGGRMGATITLLAQNTDRLDTKFHQIGHSAGQFGSDWQRASHTAAFELHSLEAGVLSLGTSLGTDLLPALNTGVHDLTDIVHWFEQGNSAAHALEITIGTLASVAIGSYLISKLRQAITLMREFGQVAMHPVSSLGGFARSTTPGAPGGAGGVAGALKGGIVGARGPEMAGSIANPIVVAIEAGQFAGLSSMGAAGTVATEQKVAQAESGAMGAAGVKGAASGGVAAAEQTATLGILGTLKSGLGSLLKAGGIVGLGALGAQAAGGLIGGSAGKTVSSVGTGAAIGAGLGSFLGPEGTIAGGIAGALAGGISHFLSGPDPEEEGKKFADKFTRDLPGKISSRTKNSLAKATAKAGETPVPTAPVAHIPLPALEPRSDESHVLFNREFNRAFNQLYTAVSAAGRKAGNTFVQSMQGVKFPTQLALTQDMSHALNNVPAQIRAKGPQWVALWRDSGAKQMIGYAEGLVRNGKLPARQLDNIIASLEHEFPGLASYLEQQGLNTAQVIARTMKLTDAQKNWRTALQSFRTEWGDEAISLKITSQNINSNTVKAMAFLKDVIAHGSREQRLAAQKEYDLLQAHVDGTFSKMGDDVAAKQASMTHSIQSGSQKAANVAGQNFASMERSVYSAMNSGVLSTAKGVDAIQKDLNATLKAFGAKPIPLAALIASEGPNPGGNFHGAGHSGTFAAGGGYMGAPGERGRDTVHAILGRGEAVLKHQDQALVNAGLARAAASGFPVGSLDGVFSATAGQKHWMDVGGYAGMPRGFDAGGYVYPLPSGTTLGRTDMGVDASMPVGAPIGPIGPARILGIAPNWYAGQPIMWWQLTGGPDAGKDVYLAEQIVPLVHPGQTVTANQAVARFAPSGTGIEMGWGTSSSQTQAQATTGYSEGQVTPAGSSFRAFLAGLSHGMIVAGGGLGQIQVPKVKGDGAVADLVRGGLVKTTAAANAYLSHAMAALAPAGGAGFTGGGTSGTPSKPGYTITGKVSYFGPPGDPAGSTALAGHTDAEPGISLHVPGTHYSDAINRGLMGHTFKVSVGGHSANLEDIDLGPADYLNRAIDVTGAGSLRMGIDPLNFPTDSIGTAVELFAGGGTAGVSHTKYASTSTKKPPKVKQPTHHKQAKLPRLPRLKSLKGFDQTLLNEIANTDTGVQELGNWYGYLDALYSNPQVQALVTLADGSQVLNPGTGPWPFDPSGYRQSRIGALTGMVDPSTGQVTRSIWDRLRSIGPAGSQDHNTLMGVDNEILYGLTQEQQFAGQAYRKFGPWLSHMTAQMNVAKQQLAWLGAATDETTPFHKLPPVNFRDLGAGPLPAGVHVHGGPADIAIPLPMWGTSIRKKGLEYKNMLAQVEWATKLKEDLPLQKERRDAQIVARFAKARHAIEISGLTSTFDAGQLLKHQEDQLGDEKRKALPSSATPRGWKGDRHAWTLEHQRERADIEAEFSDRKAALVRAAASHNLAGRISRSNALFGLSQTEAAEKLSVSQQLGHRKNTLSDLIRSDGRIERTDRSWLKGWSSKISTGYTSDQAALTAATTPQSGFGDTLRAYLDPMGTLSLAILTKENIDIPGLLTQVSELTGTAVPTGAGGTSGQDSTLLALYQQLNLQLSQTLALNEAQTSVLAGMLPMIPRYDKGGPVLDDSLAMVHRGEYVVPQGGALVQGGGGGPQTFALHQHYHGRAGELMRFIDERIQHPENVRAISRVIGKRTSMLTGAPGSPRPRF